MQYRIRYNRWFDRFDIQRKTKKGWFVCEVGFATRYSAAKFLDQ